MPNLDVKIQEVSNTLVNNLPDKKTKNKLEKVLGVLANDGVYAFYVYCKAEKIDNYYVEPLQEVLKEAGQNVGSDWNSYFIEVSNRLTDLLFVKEIIERVLIYARYHLKAKGDE